MRIEQLQTPALIVEWGTLERNIQRLADTAKLSGVSLRPHYKSHKCITIAKMQLAAGAKGITCAKLGEAIDLVEAGVEDVLIANQIIDPAKLSTVASLAKCCRLGIAVDHIENVRHLEDAAALQGAIIHCLVECEVGMGRCGVTTNEDLYNLANEINSCPHLVFEGIQAYAGNLSHEVSKQARADGGDVIETRLKQAKEFLEARGISVPEVSGCSTASVFDHIDNTVYTEFQAGSYIFMDTAYGALTDLEFEHSLFVLTTVISNAGGKTITDAGRKSVSMDQMNPVFVGYEAFPVKLSEEHSSAVLPEVVPIGSKMRIIPGHCCTCVNLHDFLYFLDGGKVVDKVLITSRGKSL